MADIQPEEFIFRSRLPDIDIPKNVPLHTYCFEHLPTFRSRPCLINGATDQVYTFGEVELTSRRVAAGMNKVGIRQGDVIMILLPNCPEFVFAFLGASFRGAVSTMANPFFTSAEVVKQAKASAAKLIITQTAYADERKDYAAENEIKVV